MCVVITVVLFDSVLRYAGSETASVVSFWLVQSLADGYLLS